MTIVSCKLPMLAGVLFLRLFPSRPWQPCGKPGNAPIVDLDQRIIDQQACGANGDGGRRRLNSRQNSSKSARYFVATSPSEIWLQNVRANSVETIAKALDRTSFAV